MKKKTTQKTVYISVFDIVGDGLFITIDEGDRVYRRVYAALKRGDKVVLSFDKIESFTGAFMSAAVAQLYKKFSEKEIRRLLEITDLDEMGRSCIDRVVESTKWRLKDPKGHAEAVRYAMDFM